MKKKTLNEYRAPVCKTCLESITPNYPEVNAQVKRSIRSPSERSSSVQFLRKAVDVSNKSCRDSFDECNVFKEATQLSVIIYDNKLNNEAFSINTVCNCRSRYDRCVYFNRPMVFVFVIVSPAKYHRKEFFVF